MAKRPFGSEEQDAARTARPKRARSGGKTAIAGQTADAGGETIGGTPAGEIGFSGRDVPEAAIDARPDAAADGRRSTSMSSEPSEEDIRLRAYQRYVQRGGGHGMDFEDWLEAERELKKRR